MYVLGSASPGAFVKCGICVCRSGRTAGSLKGNSWAGMRKCFCLQRSCKQCVLVALVSLWLFHCFQWLLRWREWQVLADSGFKAHPPQPPLSLGGYEWVSRERQEQGECVGNSNLKLSSTTCFVWDFLSLWSDCSVTQVSPPVRKGDKRPELRTKFEVWVNHGFMQWHKVCLWLFQHWLFPSRSILLTLPFSIRLMFSKNSQL